MGLMLRTWSQTTSRFLSRIPVSGMALAAGVGRNPAASAVPLTGGYL